MDNPAMPLLPWPALAAAHDHAPERRLPVLVGDAEVGSVAREHLPALAAFAEALTVADDAVRLERPAALAHINEALRRDGLIIGWRDETYALVDPATLRRLGRLERAASRFWGTLTFGAHCNGYVADAAGRPTHLWIARRSLSKATDPGKLDNLIGGGVPHDQTPLEALLREAWEEAGLRTSQLAALRPGRMVRLQRDIPEGLQHEWLYVYDLALAADAQPHNQDGEVAELQLLPVAEALALAASDQMTVDASLVTLDFALRHRLLHDIDTTGVLLEPRAWPPDG
jgi:8-oxo-dGTP pyrophosphatase MutT (NUDIX family)